MIRKEFLAAAAGVAAAVTGAGAAIAANGFPTAFATPVARPARLLRAPRTSGRPADACSRAALRRFAVRPRRRKRLAVHASPASLLDRKRQP